MKLYSKAKLNETLSIVIISILLTFIGCSSKSGKADVEVIDGVEYVHNPSEPFHPEQSVTFEEELTIGEEGESKDVTLYRPRDILVDEMDNIYISDYQDGTIKVFDPDGNYIRSIGRKGEGPGEFQALSAMAFLPDGSLLAFDIRVRRTSLFDSKGEFVSSHKWRNSHFYLILTDQSGYVADENVYGEERKLFVTKYDLNGNKLESWGEFTPMGLKIQTRGEVTLSITVPYSPQSIFAGDPARMRLYHCLNSKYLIDVFDGTGKLVRKIDRPYNPVPFTQKDAEDYYAAFDRRGNKAFSEMAREVELPEVKTITAGMKVDDRGYLWVATNETKEEKERTFRAWDIFDLDGFYACRVWLDFSPGIFVRGKMYRRHQDEETGYVVVKRYQVIWKE
jgi:hypothetical protein